MDPIATIYAWCDSEYNSDDRAETAANYNRWVCNGGFKAKIEIDGTARYVRALGPLTAFLEDPEGIRTRLYHRTVRRYMDS